MTPNQVRKLRSELGKYADYLTADMGRMERRRAMSLYMTGLLLDGERKCIVPMARRLADDPEQVESVRQQLQECVTVSRWDHDEMFRRVATKLDAELPGIEAFVIDDTGFAKKGDRSVGVHRQYSGTLGRVDNCQVAVSLHLAGEQGSGCIGMQVYLPKAWTEDRARCAKAGVPEHIEFQEKWRIALDKLDSNRSGVQLRRRRRRAREGYDE